MKTKQTTPATLSVDYTPEVRDAISLVGKAVTAFKSWHSRGDGTILPQCVEATRKALATGYLVDGRTKAEDRTPGAITGKAYASRFGTTSSEVSFWSVLATAVEAGVVIGSPLWGQLALDSGQNQRLAKATNVSKVIREGGSVEAITKAVEAETAERDRRKAAGRKARPAKGEKADAPEDGIPVTGDPKADALLAVLALAGALKRLPVEDTEAYNEVRKALASVMRKETTLRRTPSEAPSKAASKAA